MPVLISRAIVSRTRLMLLFVEANAATCPWARNALTKPPMVKRMMIEKSPKETNNSMTVNPHTKPAFKH